MEDKEIYAMPISLPIAVGKNLIGTSFVGGSKDKKYAFVTTLHQIGTESDDIFIGIPQHGGNINQVQQSMGSGLSK